MSNKVRAAQARAALAAGRVRTFGYAPYLATYIYSLNEQQSPGSGTCGVSMDGVIHWDPDFVEALDVDTLAYVVLHEALHLILKHHARAQEAYGDNPEPQLQLAMNIAGDLCIEQILAFMRPLRPAGAVHLGADCKQLGIKLDFPENKELLEYYSLILAAVRQRPDTGDGDGEGDSDGQPEEAGETGGSGDSRATKPKPQQKSGKPGSREGKNGLAASACVPGTGGSAADGVRRQHEDEDDNWKAYKENLYAHKLDQSCREHEHKHPGSVPGILKEALDIQLRPQPDPFQHLKSVVATSTANPLGGRLATYRRLSRKQPQDVCRLRGQLTTQASAVVIVDTSGSMLDRETKIKALTVIADGLRKLKSVKVVCADTHVRSSVQLSNLDKFVWDGGGGTDMATALLQVDKDDHPDSIVLITDGYTGWPERQLRARTVVALTDPGWAANVPAWCKTVPLYSSKESAA
jgi:predicted metal-dependent peptidase